MPSTYYSKFLPLGIVYKRACKDSNILIIGYVILLLLPLYHSAIGEIFLGCESSPVMLILLQFHIESCFEALMSERLKGERDDSRVAFWSLYNLAAAWFIS